MKFLKFIFGSFFLYALLFSAGIHTSSCTKKQTITDTVVVIDTVYDLTNGLVGYYNFTGGSLQDSSGYHNDIYFNNATLTADRFGHPDNAYLFNGTSSYMKVKNSASLNPANITLMAIVKMNGFYTGTCHGNQIIMKGARDQDQGVYSLRIIDAASGCAVALDTTTEAPLAFYGDFNGEAVTRDPDPIKTNQWLTIIYTYDGFQAKLFVNGQLKSTVSSTALFTINSNDLFIGAAEYPTYPFWFDGVIDQIRIYNQALSLPIINRLSQLKF